MGRSAQLHWKPWSVPEYLCLRAPTGAGNDNALRPRLLVGAVGRWARSLGLWLLALCAIGFAAPIQAAGSGFQLHWPNGGVQVWHDTLAAADQAGQDAANTYLSVGPFSFSGPFLKYSVVGTAPPAIAVVNYWGDIATWPDGYTQADYFSVQEIVCGEKYAWDSAKHQCVTPLTTKQACSNNSVGKPCDPATGNEHYVETDYTGTGPFPLRFSRTYNSIVTGNGRLGFNWLSNYGDPTATNTLFANLQVTPRFVSVPRTDGRTVFFRQVNGVWTPDADITDTLIQTASGWLYAQRDGTVETYDNVVDLAGNSRGRLLAITNPAGLSQTLTYDPVTGFLNAVADAFGHRLTFSYDSNGRLRTMTDPNGGVTTYDYDDTNNAGNLSAVTHPDDTVRRYRYNEPGYVASSTSQPHALTGIYDENSNRYATLTYDYLGRVKINQLADVGNGGPQQKFTLTYDSANQTTVIDAAGTKEVLTFATNLGVKNLLARKNFADNKTLAQTFDANNNLTCRKDEEGRVTTWTYNNSNQKLSETAGRTGTCSAPVTTAATRTTTYGYLAPDLDLPTVIESPSVAGGTLKKRTEISYDPNLRVPRTITQRGYTPAGVAVSRAVTLGYNTFGQVTSIDGPRSDVADVTTLEYYECSTGGECGQMKRVTNALSQATNFDAYDASGRLLEQTDPNGLKTFYGYDLRGRVLSVTLKSPDGTTRLTGYAYNAAGNVTEVTTPDGKVLTYVYDAAQYLRTVTDNLGHKVEYSYDLKGNRTATKTYDPQGTLVRALELAYDARNRLREINAGGGPAGSITKQVWDAIGNLTKVTDPNTVAVSGTTATVNEYDALNRLFKTTDRLSGLTQYGYDSGDRVKQVTAPNTATTGYEVDDLGNVLKETSPDRGVLTYGYDQAGNVTSLLDARGVAVTYRYDALNRLTTADFPGTEEDVTYAYDTAPGCSHGIGRLCTVSDAAGASTYAYDAFGNVTEATRTGLGVSATTRYGYDAMNRVSAITYPDGRKVDYTRNTLGQVTGVALTQGGSTQSLASQLTYRADGLLTNLTYGNGVAESRLYSLAGRLESWTVGSETRGFIYDANGNLKDKTGAAVASFSYDALDRLKDESLSGFAQSFTYDPNGNRKSDRLGSYDYLAQSNRLSTAPSGSITLDPAGNLMTQGARTFGYTGSGQLRDITEAGAPLAAYGYNSERLRTRKTVGTDTTVYHYDLAGNLLMETDAAGTPKRAYVWLNGRPLAQLDPSGIVYLHTDHLDTPRLATNSAGTTVWRWEGEAFGDTAASEDPDGDGTLTTVSLRFPGQYYDAETGLHYNWNRYYDPKIGRYITSDPVGLEGGLNTYAYVENNPLRWTDPTGLDRACGPGYRPDENNICRPDPSEDPNTKICVTAECAAGVLPNPHDKRSAEQCDVDQCEFACGAAWPGPVAFFSRKEFLEWLAGQVTASIGCDWICKDPKRRRIFMGQGG